MPCRRAKGSGGGPSANPTWSRRGTPSASVRFRPGGPKGHGSDTSTGLDVAARADGDRGEATIGDTPAVGFRHLAGALAVLGRCPAGHSDAIDVRWCRDHVESRERSQPGRRCRRRRPDCRRGPFRHPKRSTPRTSGPSAHPLALPVARVARQHHRQAPRGGDLPERNASLPPPARGDALSEE
jgi:hypothetical protein